MKEESSNEIIRSKEHNRILINVTLLGICFTLFTFLIAFNADLLNKNIFLTLQLVCSIPLFMASTLARTKSSYNPGKTRWATFGFITFTLAYSFLINVVGIFLLFYVSYLAGLVYFLVNIISALAYSGIEISYDSTVIGERIIKDGSFILLIILLGILPALRFY